MLPAEVALSVALLPNATDQARNIRGWPGVEGEAGHIAKGEACVCAFAVSFVFLFGRLSSAKWFRLVHFPLNRCRSHKLVTYLLCAQGKQQPPSGEDGECTPW